MDFSSIFERIGNALQFVIGFVAEQGAKGEEYYYEKMEKLENDLEPYRKNYDSLSEKQRNMIDEFDRRKGEFLTKSEEKAQRWAEKAKDLPKPPIIYSDDEFDDWEETEEYNSFSELYDYFSDNPIAEEPLPHMKSGMSYVNVAWMYLAKNIDGFDRFFFKDTVGTRLYNDLKKNYFPPSFVGIGFSENGIGSFQNGFVISAIEKNLYIKTQDIKIDNINLMDISSIRVFCNGVMINNKYKIKTNSAPFNAKVVADVINYIVVKLTMNRR